MICRKCGVSWSERSQPCFECGKPGTTGTLRDEILTSGWEKYSGPYEQASL